jgi:tRNA A37 threonylcarbamoyltransferase TsaD
MRLCTTAAVAVIRQGRKFLIKHVPKNASVRSIVGRGVLLPRLAGRFHLSERCDALGRTLSASYITL